MNQSKLSRLQRQILDVALQNAQAENPTSVRQIVALVLGIKDLVDPLVEQRGRVLSTEFKGYNSALASISRTLHRLEARGLVYRHGVKHGCTLFCLTAGGLKVAQDLTVSVTAPPGDGKKKKSPRKAKPLTKEQPSFLQPKRLSQADLQAAKDVEWRPLP
jgi:hypothetical protein